MSTSPARTGASQRSSDRPGEPWLVESASTRSTYIRMNSEPVNQPLAMSPPNGVRTAAAGSTWNGCGSKRRAKATISAPSIRTDPRSNESPGVKSS